MRTRFLALLALGGCSGVGLRPAAPGDALIIEGRVERTPLGLSAPDVAKLSRLAIRGRDPAAGVPARFTGAALLPLLAEGLPLKPGADTVVFHGAAGRRAAVPLNAIRQIRPVLADEVDGKPVAGAPAGGYLLAWPDVDAPGLETDPRVRWWWLPGVKRIEIVSWQEADGRALRVPPGAGDDARQGADVFATSCMTCHRVRGRGGTAGPELTAFLASGDPARVEALLPGHLAARSAWPGTSDPPPGTARQIAAFLRAVALVAAKPEDEVKEPEPPPPPPPAPPGVRRPGT